MADQPKASGVPSIRSAEDFDVQSGLDGLPREAYKASSFHTSADEEGDAKFKKAADLMEGSASQILMQDDALETEAEKEKEAATLAQVKAAAL